MRTKRVRKEPERLEAGPATSKWCSAPRNEGAEKPAASGLRAKTGATSKKKKNGAAPAKKQAPGGATNTAAAAGGERPTRLESIERMLRWARAGTSHKHQVDVHRSVQPQVSPAADDAGADEEDFGYSLSAGVPAGESMIQVSRVLCSVMATGRHAGLVNCAADAASLPRPSFETLIIVSLCAGLDDKDHPLHAHIAALPRHDPTPLGWPEAARDSLAGTALADELVRAEEALHSTTDALARAMVSAGVCAPSAITLQRRLWARGMFYSRGFRLSGPDDSWVNGVDDEGSMMLPVIDTLNHSDENNCELHVTSDSVSVVTRVAVPAGHELTINYGKVEGGDDEDVGDGGRANGVLLHSYGFAIRSNPADFYPVTISLPPTDDEELISARCHYLDQMALPYAEDDDGGGTVGPLPIGAERPPDQDVAPGEEQGTTWAEQHQTDGVAFILLALGVAGMTAADEEPAPQLLQLEELHRDLSAALAAIASSETADEAISSRFAPTVAPGKRPAKRARTDPDESAAAEPSWRKLIAFYRIGQRAALHRTLQAVQELCDQIRGASVEDESSEDE